MTPIIGNGITGQQLPHKSGKDQFGAAQKNVHMIGHHRPGIHRSVGSGSQLSQTLHKIITIDNVVDNPAFFDSSHSYMMQGPRGIQSSATQYRIAPSSIVSLLT